MKTIFSKFDLTNDCAICLVAGVIVAGLMASPRLFAAVSTIYGTLMLAACVCGRTRHASSPALNASRAFEAFAGTCFVIPVAKFLTRIIRKVARRKGGPAK